MVWAPILSEDGTGQTDQRAIYALALASIEEASKKVKKDQAVTFVRTDSNENYRVVIKVGLFTRVPHGMTLEEWVKTNFVDQKPYPW
jgi:hypothetical protein